jgi:TrmH family RNA methyltransferase
VSAPEVHRIESTSNPAVRRWRELHKRRERDRQALCVIEGAREVNRAVGVGVEFESVLVGDKAAPSEIELATVLNRSGARSYGLGEAAMAKVSWRAHAAGIIGIAHSPMFRLDGLSLSEVPLLLIADSIEKPGNVGAMIRSADGAGADAVIVSDPATDLVNPNVIRASQGAVFSAAVGAESGENVHGWLTARGIPAAAATAEATTSLWDFDLTGPIAIVIGSEHAGLSAPWREAPQIAIPMHGHSDSLNAATAAALLLYETLRQRR